jgi:arylsulfatase A-like enzyme
VPDLRHKKLGQYFKEAGYQTGYIGKWHLASTDPGKPVPVEERGGYDYWLAANALEFTSDAYRCELFDGDGKLVRLPGYRVDACTDAAIRYVDEHHKNPEPFFLFLSFIEPHFQNHVDDYPPPDGYRERYTGRWTPPDLQGLPSLGASTAQHLGGYWGMCKRLDDAFGRLVDALKSLELFDDTVILFTSDHACHFKTRNNEYKRSGHESSIRVPGAFFGERFQGGGRVNALVSLLDFPPTLLQLAGIPVPEEMQGHSILPLLRGGTDPDRPTDMFVQVSESQVGRTLRTQRWKYNIVAPGLDGNKHAGSTKYVEEYLYDLKTDPHELRNLIGYESHQKVADRLRERLVARMVAAGEKKPSIKKAPKIKSGQRRVFEEEIEQ